jgi:hypothetical protein
MKTCTIYGDLSSDRTSDNYPTVQVCDECCEADEKQREDKQIVTEGPYDPSFGDTCEFCEKTFDEEQLEK